MTDEERSKLANECFDLSAKLYAAATPLREAAKALTALGSAEAMFAQADDLRKQALDALSQVDR